MTVQQTKSINKISENFGIGFFLYSQNDKKILIHKRDEKGAQPNKWDYFGGKIEKRETPIQALKRELYEELGIKVNKRQIKLLFKSDAKHMYYILFSKKRTKEIRLDEGDGFAWFTFQEAFNLEEKLAKSANDCLNKLKDKSNEK